RPTCRSSASAVATSSRGASIAAPRARSWPARASSTCTPCTREQSRSGSSAIWWPNGRAGTSSASRTTAGAPTLGPRTRPPKTEPLAKVVSGFGNDGESGFEGARYRNAIGCYLHGPVLPKNPALADELIAKALLHRYGETDLAPLDDARELAAQAAALRIAR